MIYLLLLFIVVTFIMYILFLHLFQKVKFDNNISISIKSYFIYYTEWKPVNVCDACGAHLTREESLNAYCQCGNNESVSNFVYISCEVRSSQLIKPRSWYLPDEKGKIMLSYRDRTTKEPLIKLTLAQNDNKRK